MTMRVFYCGSAPNRYLLSISLIWLVNLQIHSATAQQAETLPTVEVTSPTTIPTSIDKVASSLTVITTADMERNQRRTAADALMTIPGLNVVQSGGPGNVTSVFTRGTNSNHTKVLIDGIEVSDPSSPNGIFDFGHLLTSDIERIEVLRGPQSGLYGSDAIGGVISIITKKGEGPPKITAMIEGGSFGTVNSAAGASGADGKFNYAFNITQFRSASVPVTPIELLAPGHQRNNDSYNNITYSTKLGYDVTEDFALNYVARYTDARLNFTGYDSTFSFPADIQSSSQVTQFFTRGEAAWSLFDGRFKNYFGVNYTNQNRNNFDPNGFPSTATNNNGDRIKYDWRGVANVLPGQTLVTGTEYQKDRYFSAAKNAENGNRGAWIELQSQFSDRLYIISNARLDDNDSFGEHSTYRLAPALIVPESETKLKASYGTGFKAPTLFQLFDSTYGNRYLKPEESTGYDAGFEQPIANDHIRFGTTYFNNHIKNIISNGPAPAFALFNIDKATTSGFETFMAIKFSEHFAVRADHTYTKAIDNSTGLELPRRPRLKMSLSAIWTPIDKLTLSATALNVGEFRDFPRFGFREVTTQGYSIFNLAANYTLANGVTAFARVDNLLNEQYQDPDGYLHPGFGVFGGLRFSSR